jgi:hypothetical protein
MTFWRNKYFIVVAAVLVIILAGIIYYYQKETRISRKPDIYTPSPTQEKQKTPSGEERWYIQFSVKQQKSTAYTEAASAPVASSGKQYHFGGVAVHPRHPLQYGGKATTPIIPYGTEIFLNKPIKIQGEERKSLVVLDTGDVNYGLWPDHPYWFDIYWGNTNYYNVKDARNYGAHLTDYYWYEPWK